MHHDTPLDTEPVALRPPYDQYQPLSHDNSAVRRERRAVLSEPLAGIALGAHDHRVLAWLANWDTPTIATVASLLHRARAAAPLASTGEPR